MRPVHFSLGVLLAFLVATSHPTQGQTKAREQKSAVAPAATVAAAQAKAVKKHPDLGKPGSAFNVEFVARVKRLQKEQPGFFKDSAWPLKLADEVAKAAARPSDPEGVLTPLWTLDSAALNDPEAPDVRVRPDYIGSLPSGDTAFLVGVDEKSRRCSVVLVDGVTGKVKWRTPFPERTEGMLEWMPSHMIIPDGRIVVATVLWRFDPTDPEANEFKRRRLAQIHLRVLDPITGKVLAHRPLTFDDPTSDKESGPVSWSGHGCLKLKRAGDKNLLLGHYFLAEFGDDFSKPLRVTRFQERYLNFAFVVGGAVVDDGRPQDRRTWTVRLGETEQPLAAPKQEWKLRTFSRQGDDGAGIVVRTTSPDGSEQESSFYDIAAGRWTWTKTEADWAQAGPGPATHLMQLMDKDRTLFFVDPATGEARYHAPAKTSARLLEDGRIFVFRKPNEIAIVNCANGKEEGVITRTEPFDANRNSGAVEWIGGDRALVVDSEDGTITISVFHKSTGKLTAPRKLTLPPFGKINLLLTHPIGDGAYALRIYQTDGLTVCAFPLPGA